jgi:hypothetical protein
MADGTVSETKTCTKCGKEKPRTAEFFPFRRKGSRDGLNSWCRECTLAHTRRWRRTPDVREKERLQSRQYRMTDRYQEVAIIRRAVLEERGRVGPRKPQLSAEEKQKAYKEGRRLWKLNNPDRVRKWQRRANAKRRGTPEGRINGRISARVWQCLSVGKGGGHWEELVGYTLPELMAHLERQFSRGMSWSNVGQWHIDYIMPLSHFKFSSASDPEFRYAWALTNLRPVWAAENIRKHAQRTLLL